MAVVNYTGLTTGTIKRIAVLELTAKEVFQALYGAVNVLAEERWPSSI